MQRETLQSDLFLCQHLGQNENDYTDILDFELYNPDAKGLVEYIRNYAFKDEEENMMRTYLVRDKDTHEIAAYFSLKAGLVSVNEREIVRENKQSILFDTYPGIELADFAVNDNYKKKHPELDGIGLVVFEKFIVRIIREAANHIGVTVLYIFSLPFESLIARYEEYGFSKLPEKQEHQLHKRLKPAYDASCIFMYMNI